MICCLFNWHGNSLTSVFVYYMRNIYGTYFQVSKTSFIGSSPVRTQSGRQSHVNLKFEEVFGFINKSPPVLVHMINFFALTKICYYCYPFCRTICTCCSWCNFLEFICLTILIGRFIQHIRTRTLPLSRRKATSVFLKCDSQLSVTRSHSQKPKPSNI